MPGNELIGIEERNAVNEIFDNGNFLYRYAKGAHRVGIFEKELSCKVGADYCHAVSNGTSALKDALLAMDIKRGDCVITQSHTFIATVEAILEIGANPVICEVNETLNMDPENLLECIEHNDVSAIIPVHMGGVPCEMSKIMKIANDYAIPVLEDSCQALGAKYDGKYLGTIGDAGCYSFDFGKIITTGEGGAVVTNKENIYLDVRAYSDHGHDMNPNFPRGEDTRRMWGFNYKMTEIQGAIGLAQLGKMDYIIKKQRENCEYLYSLISDLGVEFRDIPMRSYVTGDTLTFFMDTEYEASKVSNNLVKEGIGTKNLPDALDWHFAGTWKHIRSIAGQEFPMSEKLLMRAIALPIMVKSSEEELDEVAKKVRKAMENV